MRVIPGYAVRVGHGVRLIIGGTQVPVGLGGRVISGCGVQLCMGGTQVRVGCGCQVGGTQVPVGIGCAVRVGHGVRLIIGGTHVPGGGGAQVPCGATVPEGGGGGGQWSGRGTDALAVLAKAKAATNAKNAAINSPGIIIRDLLIFSS